MIDECKQGATTSSTNMKKNSQINTFYDGLKAWMDLYRHRVYPGSYLKYEFSIYKAKYDNQVGKSPWQSWRYLICIITRWLRSYNAQPFNDDVTAIGVSYCRKEEFTDCARLHRGIMWHSGAIWQHKSGSTLAQVKAPTHYLNHCWLISKIHWH